MSKLGPHGEMFLDAGEDILWQGQPQSRIIWRDLVSIQTPVGLFFAGFAIFWIIGARSSAGIDQPLVALLFPLAGAPFVLIGLWLVIGRLVWDAALRAGTFYTLTTRHAYIARHMLGRRSLESWPLADIDGLELIDGHPGAVLFKVSPELRRERLQPLPVKAPIASRRPALGFRQIEDPRRVYRLIHETQGRMRPQ